MAYHNRLPQLKHTLANIAKTSVTNFEIIVVDDFSTESHNPVYLIDDFCELNITVISMRDRIDKKTYSNPCIPYNIGFRESKGDKIIIQNPECCHVGDVLSYVDKTLTDDNYLTFHCFAADMKSSNELYSDSNGVIDVNKLTGQWYNHGTIKPMGYHFTSAITRKNLCALNGFDERYADGECYDDDEIFRRIRFLGKEICFVGQPWVIHQWHDKDKPFDMVKVNKNKSLFLNDQLTNFRADNNIDICGI